LQPEYALKTPFFLSQAKTPSFQSVDNKRWLGIIRKALLFSGFKKIEFFLENFLHFDPNSKTTAHKVTRSRNNRVKMDLESLIRVGTEKYISEIFYF